MNTWYPGLTLEDLERSAIEQAIKHYHGNIAATASALGVSERTIRNKIEKYESQNKVHELRRKKQENLAELQLKYHRGEITTDQWRAARGLEPQNSEYLPVYRKAGPDDLDGKMAEDLETLERDMTAAHG